MKIIKMLLPVLFLMALLSVPVQAQAPYASYTYDSYGEAVEMSAVYEPDQVFTGASWNLGQLIEPQDMIISPKNELHILDSGNDRVVVLDKSLSLVRVIDQFTLEGVESPLNDATGIFVDGDDNLYIADTGNNRVVCADAEGKIFRVLEKPESEYFSDHVEFLPKKLVRDRAGNLYVQCTGIYQGAVIFDNQYTFQGFFGSEKVATTAEAIRDYFWKQLMTEEQKEIMAGYVPSEICNMDITADDFIYTISTAQFVPGEKYKMEMDSIRCLNPKGSDTIVCKMPENAYKAMEFDARQLNFVDVSYDANGFLNVLDNKRGKIYQFDQDMQLICAFGALGEYAGTFIDPVAIETLDNCVLVLDRIKCTLTVFRTTQVGETIHKALMLYYDGQYVDAIDPWKQVIQENPNYELAYIGIGSALYNQQEYEQAMEYFLFGRDEVRYSEAFQEYRIALLRDNLLWIACGVAVLIAGVYLVRFLRKKARGGE